MQAQENPQSDPIAVSTSLAKSLVELRWQGRCLFVLTTIAVGFMLYVLSEVLIPFVVALFLTAGLKPILELFQRRLVIGRISAVTVAFLLTVSIVVLLALALTNSIESLRQNKAYQRSLERASTNIASIADSLKLLPESTPETSEVVTSNQAFDPGVAPFPLKPVYTTKPATERLKLSLHKAADQFQTFLLTGMLSISSSMGIVIIYMLFLLLGASKSPEDRNDLWILIEEKLREYFLLKSLISLVTGILVWAVLVFFDVPLALFLGLLTFLLNFIPNFGPLATCLIPLPLIWLHPELSLLSMCIASGLTIGIQLVGGNVVEPRMMGSSFDLHPIVVLLVLMLWFAIWGFVGMLLAVPMTAVLRVILEKIEHTRPIALLMAGDLSEFSVEEQAA